MDRNDSKLGITSHIQSSEAAEKSQGGCAICGFWSCAVKQAQTRSQLMHSETETHINTHTLLWLL